MKPRILLVSTYSSLAEKAISVSEELNIPITIYEGGIMKNGHLYAKEMEKNFDVIISQGSTASVIKDMVSIPVIPLEISTVDLLNALDKAKEFGDKIGLVCHKTEELETLESLKHLFNISFKVFPYSDKKELEKQIEEATTIEKMTIVAMGSCIIEIANCKDLNSVLTTCTKGAVKKALIAAKNICDLSKRDKERAQWLRSVIDYSIEGIVALYKDGSIITVNKSAEKFLGLKAEDMIEQNIKEQKDCLKSLYGDGSCELGKLFMINNIQTILNRVPIIVDGEQIGTVLAFQEVSKLLKLGRKVRTELYNKGLVCKYNFSDILGESKEIMNTIEKAKKYGVTSSIILIEGETGSGKELFAQSIHNISNRNEGPFVAINCAALPESLLESELFGYDEGAFTGAKKGGKPGLFELADGGTIFLDEIGEISMKLQSRLLRVLQEKEVMRIGGDHILEVDTRVIAATNIELYDLVEEGNFREDLYFRLNVLNLKIPPLRKRNEDIPILIRNQIKILSDKYNTKVEDISDEGINILKEYDWPGNVRELSNFVEKLIILGDTSILDKDFIKDILKGSAFYAKTKKAGDMKEEVQNSISIKVGELKNMELQIIEALNEIVNHDKIQLAQKLGISRTTLWKRLKELQIEN